MRHAWFHGKGGNMRNAIPRECEVVITIPAEEEADVMEYVQECETLWNEEYHVHANSDQL